MPLTEAEEKIFAEEMNNPQYARLPILSQNPSDTSLAAGSLFLNTVPLFHHEWNIM